MATEAVKDVLSKRETDSKSEENCLVLLDGQTSNYGGEENLLRSKTEILDPYFEQQVGVDIEFATLEKADRQYPEATVADCACCLYVEAVENEGIDAADTVERFDDTRSVPSVETDGRVYKIAPQGVTNADKFESKVVAWAVGKRTADEPLGTLDEQFERVIERKIGNQVIVDYILSIRSQPESRQA